MSEFVFLIIAHLFTLLFRPGDEIDVAYQKEIQEVVDMTGSPESAFKIFNDVVKNVFEWDESTGSGIVGVARHNGRGQLHVHNR